MTEAMDKAFVRLHVASLEFQGKEIRADDIATRFNVDKALVLSVCCKMLAWGVIKMYSDLVPMRLKYSQGDG